jgi:hypothetical protein
MGIRTWMMLGVGVLSTALVCLPWNARANDTDSRCRNEACEAGIAGTKEKVMIVNSRRIKLNYSIEDVGPSGVSTVELWATRDGKSWARYSNEPPPDGPLVVHVAEEGRYGFSIVVRNGLGMASATPKAGDEPQVWVVVDETKPSLVLKRVTAGSGPHAGTLTVEWSASDERLTDKPITLSIATKKEGPYTPIATAIENTGRYVWHMPREHPYAFFLRVEAEDQAGNVGLVTTPEPIRIDLTRPRGTITGVSCEKKSASLTVIPAPAEKPETRANTVSPPVLPGLNFITTPER